MSLNSHHLYSFYWLSICWIYNRLYVFVPDFQPTYKHINKHGVTLRRGMTPSQLYPLCHPQKSPQCDNAHLYRSHKQRPSNQFLPLLHPWAPGASCWTQWCHCRPLCWREEFQHVNMVHEPCVSALSHTSGFFWVFWIWGAFASSCWPMNGCRAPKSCFSILSFFWGAPTGRPGSG